jgi:hypothetical protein
MVPEQSSVRTHTVGYDPTDQGHHDREARGVRGEPLY